MSRKAAKIPDSDQLVRGSLIDDEDRSLEDLGDTENRQTSQKTGKHSSVEKKAASRPEFNQGVGHHPVPGAHGDPTPKEGANHERANTVNARPGEVSNNALRHAQDDES